MKKILMMVLSLVLVAALSIGGTVAYLQDDDSDVNVMTLGNVSIEQHEYERVVNADGTYKTDTIDNQTSYVLKDFTQGKALLPSAINTTTWEGWDWDSTIVRMTQVDSYGGMQVFKSASNAQDKFVVVKNTGKTDAYVRTLVAIEIGSASADLLGTSYHSTWTKNVIGTIAIDGVNYYLSEYVYAGGQLSDSSWRHENGVLPAGDTAYPNFSQVYIQSRATNEDMVALDGNGNGTLDILVVSQAVQADGFDNAETALNAGFGDITTTNHPWADGVDLTPTRNPATITVNTTEEAQDALYAALPGDTIQLTAGNYGKLMLQSAYVGEARTIKNLTIKGEAGVNVAGIEVGNKTTLNNVVIEGINFTGEHDGFHCNAGDAAVDGLTINNCTMTDDGTAQFVSIKTPSPKNVKITNCTVDGAQRLITMVPSQNVTITGNTMKNLTVHGILLDNSGGKYHTGTIVIESNTYDRGKGNEFIRIANLAATNTLIIKNNTVTNFMGGTSVTPYEDNYINITTANNADVAGAITIMGNTATDNSANGGPARGDLHITVNDARYNQPVPQQ